MDDTCITCGMPGARYDITLDGFDCVGVFIVFAHPHCIKAGIQIARRNYALCVIDMPRNQWEHVLRREADPRMAAALGFEGDVLATPQCGCRVTRRKGIALGLVRHPQCRLSVAAHGRKEKT